ncbi:MAG: heme exporter protein CcmD [Pseudomonadota bacterium]
MNALLADPYLPYVAASYGATVAIIGLLIWRSVRANALALREMEAAEQAVRSGAGGTAGRAGGETG